MAKVIAQHCVVMITGNFKGFKGITKAAKEVLEEAGINVFNLQFKRKSFILKVLVS
jgi:hypothetical protein